MISLANTINELKKDNEEIKTNIKKILSLLQNNKEPNYDNIKEELSNFFSDTSNSINRFSNIYTKSIFNLNECKSIIQNYKEKLQFYKSSTDKYESDIDLSHSLNKVDIEKLSSVKNMISNKLYDLILPECISLYKLKTYSHISFKVIDFFVVNCYINIDLNTKPTLFTVSVPLETNIDIEINEKLFELSIGDIIIYCGNKPTKTKNRNIWLIMNIEFEYYN
jgi:hypothetical protein